jgi:hypothetical protein
MDGPRFDAFSHALVEPRTRRGLTHLLGAVALIGSLVQFGQSHTAARKKGGKRKKRRKKRRCIPQCAGQQCGDDGCGGSCGSCGAVACNGAICLCAAQVDGTDCGGGRQCSSGVCATPPGCRNLGCFRAADCCSGFCNLGIVVCFSSNAGQPCTVDSDCGTNRCVGFVCQV